MRALPRLALLTLMACTPAQVRWADGVGLALSSATIACDWGQTRSAAADGWGTRYEAGPLGLMTTRPEAGVVDLYFTAASLAAVAGTRLLPVRWRPLAHAVVVGLETNTVIGNVRTTRGTCGL